MLASVLLKRGRTNDAEHELEAIYRLEPGFRPDLNLYPPSFIRFAQRIDARVKKVDRVPLTISTTPSKLMVFIDGRPFGRSPLTTTLPPGEYKVEVAWGVRKGLTRTVSVESSMSVELSESFEGAVYADAGPCMEAPPSREARLAMLARLAPILRADELVTVRIEEPASNERYYVGAMYKVKSGQETREGKIKVFAAGPPPGSMARLAEFLTTGTANEPVQAVAGAIEPTPTIAREPREPAPATAITPVTPALEGASSTSTVRSSAPSRVPAYAAAALSGVLLVTSAYALMTSNDANTALSSRCPLGSCLADGWSDAEFEKLRSTRETSRTTGFVALGAGLAAAGVSAFLFVRADGPDATVMVAPISVTAVVGF